MTDRPGEFVQDGQQLGIRFERRLRKPAEVVWAALTESDKLEAWLPCDIVGERRSGARVTLRFWPEHAEKYQIPADQVSLAGEIRAWDPPRTFEWTWDVDLLRFDLTAEGAGTRLAFTTWFGQTGEDGGSAARTAAGYHVCLEQLQELVETGRVRVRLLDQPTDQLERIYSKQAEDLGIE